MCVCVNVCVWMCVCVHACPLMETDVWKGLVNSTLAADNSSLSGHSDTETTATPTHRLLSPAVSIFLILFFHPSLFSAFYTVPKCLYLWFQLFPRFWNWPALYWLVLVFPGIPATRGHTLLNTKQQLLWVEVFHFLFLRHEDRIVGISSLKYRRRSGREICHSNTVRRRTTPLFLYFYFN